MLTFLGPNLNEKSSKRVPKVNVCKRYWFLAVAGNRGVVIKNYGVFGGGGNLA